MFGRYLPKPLQGPTIDSKTTTDLDLQVTSDPKNPEYNRLGFANHK